MPAMNPRSAVGLAQAVGDGLAHSQRGFRCDNVVFCLASHLTTWGFAKPISAKHNIVTSEALAGREGAEESVGKVRGIVRLGARCVCREVSTVGTMK